MAQRRASCTAQRSRATPPAMPSSTPCRNPMRPLQMSSGPRSAACCMVLPKSRPMSSSLTYTLGQGAALAGDNASCMDAGSTSAGKRARSWRSVQHGRLILARPGLSQQSWQRSESPSLVPPLASKGMIILRSMRKPTPTLCE